MSKLLNDLKKLISPESSMVSSGKILSVSGSTAIVSTKDGSVEMSIAGSGSYNLGDSVRVLNNTVVGRSASTNNLPHFYV